MADLAKRHLAIVRQARQVMAAAAVACERRAHAFAAVPRERPR